MDHLSAQLSPYRVFTRSEWAKLRADTPLTLSAEEVEELRGVNDRINLDEVIAIYLPLSRLLNLYVAASQDLFKVTQKFLGGNNHKVPYIIGVAGSVAGGKSTTARILRGLLARWPNHPKVSLLPTDGFLLPNAVLEREGLMNRKGFPESYDLPVLLNKLIVEGYDYVKGNRLLHENIDFMPKYRFFGNAILTILTKFATGYYSLMDPQCGYTAVKNAALRGIPIERILLYRPL